MTKASSSIISYGTTLYHVCDLIEWAGETKTAMTCLQQAADSYLEEVPGFSKPNAFVLKPAISTSVVDPVPDP
jgi:hypothetical protein